MQDDAPTVEWRPKRSGHEGGRYQQGMSRREQSAIGCTREIDESSRVIERYEEIARQTSRSDR